MYNKPRPKGAGNPSQAIEVTNIKNNKIGRAHVWTPVTR